MRKITATVLLFFIFMISLTACNNPQPANTTIETPVTVEMANTDGQYVARAYIESLFFGNRPLFEACYPEGFLTKLGNSAGVDIYDEYKKIFNLSGTFLGTVTLDYRDITLANGYDEAYMRSRISTVTGFGYGDIEVMQIRKVQVVFEYDSQELHTDFYVIVYKAGGSWYVLETLNSDVGF